MKNTMETRHVHRAGSPMRLYRYIPLPFVRIILVLGYYHRILGGLGPVASRDESEVVVGMEGAAEGTRFAAACAASWPS